MKNYEQPANLTTGDWLGILLHIYTEEYYLGSH